MNQAESKPLRGKNQIGGWLIGISLLIPTFAFSLLQGYWRHDSWIYTDSEAHEIIDGKWLAEPLHAILHNLPPALSLLLTLLILSLFLTAEISRIHGGRHWTSSMAAICALSLFSPSVLSQLHWPTHSLAGSLPLLLSMVWMKRSSLAWRLWRAFLISFGSLSILSSFTFFAPLCILPGWRSSQSLAEKHPCRAQDAWAVAIGSPALLAASLLLTKLIRDAAIANHASLTGLPSRLDQASATNYAELIPSLTTSFNGFLLRQWGWIGLSIPIIIILISAWSLATQLTWRISISFAMIWILLAPIFAAIGSGTGWQRVALAWCCIPALAALSITDWRQVALRRVVLLILMAASIWSTFIGIYNFGISALSTRELRNKISRQIEARELTGELLIIDAHSIDSLSPNYIWGGWPPFAKSKRQNVRFHRVLNELHVHHYVIREGSFVFPPDLSSSACSRHAAGHHELRIILDCYNKYTETYLKSYLHIRL